MSATPRAPFAAFGLALLLTAIVFFIRDSPTSPYNSPWRWGDRDVADAERIDAVELLPGVDEPVRASASVLPLLAERVGVYELDTASSADLDEMLDRATLDVDWLIFDPSAESVEDIGIFRSRLLERGWEPISRSEEAGIEDPTELMTFWERVLDLYPVLGQRAAKVRPERFVSDRQISAGFVQSAENPRKAPRAIRSARRPYIHTVD